jgi:hypothetical protein
MDADLPKREVAITNQLGERMAENKPQTTVSLSYEQLQELLQSVIASASKLNPLEQKKMDEELERDRRRAVLAVELGRAEEEARWRRQNSCSHSRHASTGAGVTRGTGIWTTCGQTHGDDSISLICMRCATLWHFKATPEEREYANNAGLLGFEPPAIERCLNKNDFASRPRPRTEAVPA